MSSKRKGRILELIQQVNDFRLCSPSDDPDEQTAVTVGYRHLLVQLQTLAPPILPEGVALRLKQIHVSVDDIYSVYAAKAQLDAVILEIEELLEHFDGELLPTGTNVFIVDAALITRLE